MLDREKIVVVLKRRFPGSAPGQIAAAANAIVGLEDEWVELSTPDIDWMTVCRDGCNLQGLSRTGAIKVFLRLEETGS